MSLAAYELRRRVNAPEKEDEMTYGRMLIALLIAALMVIAGCSEDTSSPEPADTTAPTITDHYPADGATGVSRSGPYWITFSEPMDEDMVEYELAFDPDPGDCDLSWNDNTILITPHAVLDGGTQYTITIDGNCDDLHGNEIGSDYSFSFTTTAAADETPPTVIGTTPTDGATGVSPIATITITFSEPMSRSSIYGAIELSPEPDDYDTDWNGVTLSIDHSPFPQNTTVTVTITTDATDLSGNHLAANYVFDFTTLIDNIRPTLVSAAPANGATGVSTGINSLTLNFSETMYPDFDMPPENVDARVIHDIDGENGDWNLDYTSITVPVRAGVDLLAGCTYWVDFEDITDTAGNPIDPNPTTYQFTTSGTPVYFLVESGVIWFEHTAYSESEERRIENYNPGSGTFDIVFEDSYGIHDVWHCRATGSEIQHLGRDEYDEGTYEITMMWDEPLTFLRLPVPDHAGETWSFSTGASLGAGQSLSLVGSVSIEPYQQNVISEEMHGMFKGCYVHHLDATITFYEYDTPVDTSEVHDTSWLAEGIGWIKIISEEDDHGIDTFVVTDWDI
jgi:hypothetical protein